MARFIKLYEDIIREEWFRNRNAFQLFIYLMIKANFAESTFEGFTVYRGQTVTSLRSMAQGTGMTVKKIRTALNHLIQAGEAAVRSTNRYSVITMLRYDYHQRPADGGQAESGKRAHAGQKKGTQKAEKEQAGSGKRANKGQAEGKETKGGTADEGQAMGRQRANKGQAEGEKRAGRERKTGKQKAEKGQHHKNDNNIEEYRILQAGGENRERDPPPCPLRGIPPDGPGERRKVNGVVDQ